MIKKILGLPKKVEKLENDIWALQNSLLALNRALVESHTPKFNKGDTAYFNDCEEGWKECKVAKCEKYWDYTVNRVKETYTVIFDKDNILTLTDYNLHKEKDACS